MVLSIPLRLSIIAAACAPMLTTSWRRKEPGARAGQASTSSIFKANGEGIISAPLSAPSSEVKSPRAKARLSSAQTPVTAQVGPESHTCTDQQVALHRINVAQALLTTIPESSATRLEKAVVAAAVTQQAILTDAEYAAPLQDAEPAALPRAPRLLLQMMPAWSSSSQPSPRKDAEGSIT